MVHGEVPDTDEEPPVPPALSRLTAPLEAMIDFLRIDGDLIAAAGEAREASPQQLDALGRRVDAAWDELEALVSKSTYDAALALARNLRDLAARDGHGEL